MLVIGDAMLDVHIEGRVDRLCREAPVPVVAVERTLDQPGGAANTAVNARSLGAQVDLMAPLGDDAHGQRLATALHLWDVGTAGLLVQPLRTTLAKQRVAAGGQLLARLDTGVEEALDAPTLAAALTLLPTLHAAADAVVISDYGYGALHPAVVAALHTAQAERRLPLVVDAKHPETYRSLRPTAVKPNYGEAIDLLGLLPSSGADRVEQVAVQVDRLLDITNAEAVVVTLDADGVVLCAPGRSPQHLPAMGQPDNRTAGAGDTFVAALALGLAAGEANDAAVAFAAAAAAVVVGQPGTSVCRPADLQGTVRAKLATGLADLRARADAYHAAGRRIVLANGCFDLLHRGHTGFLRAARELGDVLVVAVNTDEGVRRMRGPGRPINPAADRVAVLQALSCVDDLVVFDGETAEQVVRAVRPAVFAKGGNYTRSQVAEAAAVADVGGEVVILPYLEAHSTIDLVHRIRAGAV